MVSYLHALDSERYHGNYYRSQSWEPELKQQFAPMAVTLPAML